jgi:hypothetical protein
MRIVLPLVAVVAVFLACAESSPPPAAPAEVEASAPAPAREDPECVGDRRTRLSARAGLLRAGMTRAEVIDLLGPADWAGLPSDTGRFLPSGDRGTLRLGWSNGDCPRVEAEFGPALVLTGQDEGRWGGPGVQSPLPPSRSCTLPDRVDLCR